MSTHVVARSELDELLKLLSTDGYEIVGPTVEDESVLVIELQGSYVDGVPNPLGPLFGQLPGLRIGRVGLRQENNIPADNSGIESGGNF